MAAEKTETQQERTELRAQLRQAGWRVGEQRVRVELQPKGSRAGEREPRWIEGADLTDALRSAVRELCGQAPQREPERPDTASE